MNISLLYHVYSSSFTMKIAVAIMKQASEFCMHNNLFRNQSHFIFTSRSHEINSSEGHSLTAFTVHLRFSVGPYCNYYSLKDSTDLLKT